MHCCVTPCSLELAVSSSCAPKGHAKGMQASTKAESAASCFKSYPESDMMRWTLDRAEDVYQSTVREPLGKSWVRGHQLPEQLGTTVPFGRAVNAKQNSAVSLARQAIAPVDAEYEVWHLYCQIAFCSTCVLSSIAIT